MRHIWCGWFLIKAAGIYNNAQPFFLKTHWIHDQVPQFWFAYGFDDEEDKEELIKVETMSIQVSNRNTDGYVARGDFVNTWVKDKA